MLAKLKALVLVISIIGLPVLGCSCMALCIQMMALGGPSAEQGQQRADDIIIALEVYRQAYGKHPADLEQLIPDFLPQIPRPAWEYEYYYDVCPEGIGYGLSFRLGGSDDYCGFNSETAKWTCTDSYWYDSPC